MQMLKSIHNKWHVNTEVDLPTTNDCFREKILFMESTEGFNHIMSSVLKHFIHGDCVLYLEKKSC